MESGDKDVFTILAVDDIPENLDVIKGVLVPEYRVKSAINGKTALKIAHRQQPDLILLDIMMPVMDGYEVCKKLKESEVTKDIPVIFVTAMDTEHDELHGFSLGAVDYVRKPITNEILKARVEAQLALRKAQRELEKKNKQLRDEREMVEKIVNKMRTDPSFDKSNLRFYVEPLEKTNGDVLFSAFRPDGGQHVLLGDFTGHGLKAAIGGPLVATYFYLHTLDGLGGWELLKVINKALCDKLPAETFMVAAFVEISPERDKFKLWNAAIQDQLLVVDNPSYITNFPSTVPPLGLFENIEENTSGWIDWPDSGRIYLYSDGVVEPENSDGEMFGVNRLKQLLGAPGMAVNGLEKIVEQVLSFTVAGKSHDDITLLEISR
jgi:two-component system, HptB-dependent secretion and biofilm response regulator